jgi:putative ABC transport system permease protein
MFVPKKPERAGARVESYSSGFTEVDRERVFSDVPGLERVSMLATLDKKDAVADTGRASPTDLVAADSAFFELYRMRVAEGRAFDESENRRHAPVCVVGHKLAERLWDGSPREHWLEIGNMRCRVIGVFANNDRFGLQLGFNWTDLVVVPHATATDAMPEVRAETMLMVKTRSPESNELAKRVINARLIERHHGIDDFTIYDFSSVLQRFDATFRILEALVGLIAAIALVIGGVGVMNMMLVSVSERVREIGLRKALGARPSDIGRQFSIEAMVLSGVGGLSGVSFGVAVALGSAVLIRRALPGWVGTVSWPAVVTALVSALVVGGIFGWAPARRAARLDPVEAMRR